MDGVRVATPLSAIIAFARAGALDHAWRQFVAAGHDRDDADPAALTLKGRLLKDRAARSAGEERRRLYLASAEAYRASAALHPATYPLINAATLSLLAGDRVQAAAAARQVLERIEREPDEPETPYYRASTRAEALLLLDRADEARLALAEAMAAAPRAWEDHATTLRQFALIQATSGDDAGWLDALRPPRSLHYAGHMAFAADGRRLELDAAIARVLVGERIGFAYGALAAGADIIVAEALLAHGAELHVVLPGGEEGFARTSVDPYGEGWRRRFDAVLAAAETVRTVRPVGDLADPRMIALADEVAMGAALMNAERIASDAVQLIVVDTPPEGTEPAVSEAVQAKWVAMGRRRHLVAAPREPLAARPIALEERPGKALHAVLAIDVGGDDDASLEAWLVEIAGALAAAPAAGIGPYLDGRRVLIGYDRPGTAAEAAGALRGAVSDAVPLRIAGHYGLFRLVRDPFSGAMRLAGSGIAIAEATVASTAPGSICVTEDFATAFYAAARAGARAGFIGELDSADGGEPIGLYALTPAARA